ncbi:SDR family oxidoreductase [Demequina sp. NBRC 110057]|uniref:SDR family oxidoreductase n=1 Tax=Demequina sp. NBRC 110057 TaxID=1570346 RepID=UPI0009FBB803|nr:SDR family oxidoreductase [Demequina sp. NBRC 110057]
MTTYAVTGTSGRLGRLIVEHLLARDVAPSDIVAIARTESKVADLADKGVTVRHGDYDEPASLDAALAGVDRLVLVSASEPGKRLPQHQAVIAAAEKAGVSRILYTSILGADTTTNPLAGEHVATEEALAASAIPATILRNSWYYENYTAQIPQYLANGAITTATNNARISAATRSDYAEAAAAAALQDAEGKVYELGAEPFTMTNLAETLTTATDTDVRHHAVSVDELVGGMVQAGLDEGTARFWAGVDASIAKGDLVTESTDLADLIGHEPTRMKDAVLAAL